MKDDTLILLGLGAAAIFWISSQDVRAGVGDTVSGVGDAVSGLGSGIGTIGSSAGSIAGDISGVSDQAFGLVEDIFSSARSGLDKWLNRSNSDPTRTVEINGVTYDDLALGTRTVYSKKTTPYGPRKSLVTQSNLLTSALRSQGFTNQPLLQTTSAALMTQKIFEGNVLVATKDYSSGALENVKIIKKSQETAKKASKYSVQTVSQGTIKTKSKIANKAPLTDEQLATAKKFGLI